MIKKTNLLDTVFNKIESNKTISATTFLPKMIFTIFCKTLKVKGIVKIFYQLLSPKNKKIISKKILTKLWKFYRMANKVI